MPRSEWTMVRGLPIHARVATDRAAPNAPRVVLVHGIGVASRYFVPLAERMAPHAHVYAPDLPGFGKSGKPRRALSIVQLAEALAAWMRTIGLERAALLGNSVGCQIVAQLAVRHPGLVERVILTGPTLDPGARTFLRTIVRWQANNRHERLAQLPLNVRDYLAAGIPRLIRSLQLAVADRIEEQLPRIGVPALVIRGELDALVPQTWAEEVARLLPAADLVVIPGAAHTVNFNAPDELARVVVPLLRGERPGLPGGVPTAAPVAGFDSASAMVQATASALEGKSFPLLGTMPAWLQPALAPIGTLINRVPAGAREQVFIWSGRLEAIPPEQLREVRAEQLAQFAIGHYPRRRYPAVALGSSNGALAHLWAALGIPWLPQTVLIPVRRSGVPPDDPRRELAWGRGPARWLLDANPGLQLHQMHDPNQDRLMVQRMSYFRVKHRQLPATYRRYLEEILEPEGTLFLVECGLCWPTTQAGDRHVFQFGALGGATPDEYLHGGPRVAAYLERYGSPRRRWDPPEPDGERPEAEWGFEATLGADVEALARERGWRVRRIVFEQPEDVSPFVADLYRWWYRQLGRPDDRLLVESFALLEPDWVLRRGAAPFWTVFGTQPSAAAIERYLERAEHPFDEIDMLLFSHGVESIGLAPIPRWQAVLDRARRRGQFAGVDTAAFPRDFGVTAHYDPALYRLPGPRFEPPPPLTLGALDRFIGEAGDAYPVRWIESPAPHEFTASVTE